MNIFPVISCLSGSADTFKAVWTQEKWDRWQTKATERAKRLGTECFPPGQCKDKPNKGGATPDEVAGPDDTAAVADGGFQRPQSRQLLPAERRQRSEFRRG